MSADEGSTATYQVALSVQPSGNVTLTLESSDTGALEVSPRSLTFTTSDWDVRQTVTVRGVEDSGTADETVTVTHTATGGGYDTASGILTVTVDDDDTASSGGSSGGSSGSGGGSAGGSDRADISGASPYSGARHRGPTHQGTCLACSGPADAAPAESQDGFPLWVSVLIIFGLGVLAVGAVLIYLRRRYRPTPPGTRR